ncbi:MAG: CHAT domain-containing tetratricopeptide repeat protein [Balneolales bacterium]
MDVYKIVCLKLALCLFISIEVEAQIAAKADSLHDAARALHLDNSLNESRELYNQALDIYISRNDTVSQVKTLEHLNSVNWRLGKHEEALELAKKGLELAGLLGDMQSTTMFLTDLGTIRSRQGYYDEAVDYLSQALELANEADDSDSASLILNNYANLNRRMGNLQESIRQFKLSLELIEDTGDLLGVAITLNSLGVSYLDYGMVQQALESFEQSLKIRLEEELFGNMAIMYNNIGMTHRRLGNNLLALDYLDKSLENYRDNENEYGSAATLRNIGIIHAQQNDLERAEYYHLQSYEIYSESDDPSSLSTSMNALGRLYIRLNDYKKAFSFFEQRLELEEKIGDLRSIGSAYRDMGYYYNSTGEYEKALSYYTKAYSISSPFESKSLHVDFLSNIGTTHVNMQSYDMALEHLNRAYEIGIRINPDLPNLHLTMEIAELHHAMGSDSSFYYAEILYDAIENQRVQIGAAGSAKANFFSSFASFYIEVASWYLNDNNQTEQAFRWTEAAKARAFIDDLAEASYKLDAQLDPELLDEKVQKSKRVVELTAELEQITDDIQRKKTLDELRSAELKYDGFLSRLRISNPVYSRFDYPDPLSLKQAKAKVGLNTLYLGYSFSDSQLVSFAISNNKTIGWAIENPILEDNEHSKIDKLVIEYRDAIINKRSEREVKKKAGNLAEILLGPAREMLENADKLIIVAEGMLTYLPYEALVWNKDYMIQNYQIKYSPSITALDLIREPQQEYDKDMLQVVNPEFGGSQLNPNGITYTSLPSSTLEARAISPHYKNVTLLQGENATENNIKNHDLDQYRYLHFATHGLLNEKSSELSGLVLAQGESNKTSLIQEDGFLRSAEIYALSINADIVVLSACETGLGKLVRGEGVLGLQRAFFNAGASTVVVSLWPVYDRSTSVLMENFYKELIQLDRKWSSWTSTFQRWVGWDTDSYGYKAGAMRNAKLALLDSHEYSHPVHWAPFIVVGK